MRHFVILSRQRSGSHMLMNLLNSHPLVRCNGDLMTPDVEKFGEEWAYETGFRHHSTFRDEVPVSEGKCPEIVGFPIKIKQNLHQTIRKRPGLKIILLERRNRLAVLLSRELGNVLRLYPDNGERMAEFSKRHSSHPPINIDPSLATAFFEEQSAKTEEVLKGLEGTDWAGVLYKDLCAETNATMRTVFAHLGVAYQKPRLSAGWGSTKLNKRNLAESIANYSELKRYFAATKWADYFTEEI
jgi:hypothetical protein